MRRMIRVPSAVLPVVLLVGLCVAVSGCSSLAHAAPEVQVAHTVFFWLKADAPATTRAEMIAFYRHEVVKAPGVVSSLAGVPQPSDRDVVDDSFTLGTTVVFASSDAEVAWQTEPIHDELKRLFFAHIDRVVVYDTLVTR